MQLYTYFRSSAAYRVRIAMNLKGLAYDPAFVHLARGKHNEPEYAAVNPAKLVPALIDNVRHGADLAIGSRYVPGAGPLPSLNDDGETIMS